MPPPLLPEPPARTAPLLVGAGLLLAGLLLLGLAALAGCASAEEAQDGDGGTPATTLRVENRSGLMMTIYVLRSSQRVRLGQVSGYDEETFTLPDHLVRGLPSLRFLADPLAGSRSPVSQEILVEPGDAIELLIPNY